MRYQYIVFATVLVTMIYFMGSISWPAQDWIPYQVAGQLWLHGQGVYANGSTFSELSCAWYQNAHECSIKGATPFVATPLALPIAAMGLSAVCVRLLGAACLAYAVYKLRLGWETLCLMPGGVHCLLVGQTAPVLIAAAVALPGLAGVLLGLCVAFKASPALLLLPLVIHRRRVDLASFGVTLLVLQAICWVLHVPGADWFTWMTYMQVVHSGLGDTHANIAAPPTFRLIALLLLIVGLVRTRSDFHAGWWLTWAAWPLLIPLNWWYYAWVTLGAVASARLPRWVTVMAVLGMVMFTGGSIPRHLQWLWEASCFGLVLWAFAFRKQPITIVESSAVSFKEVTDVAAK